MELFEIMESYRYEDIHFFYDRQSHLKAVISIHDTTHGPALGGTRCVHYENDQAAIEDVLRLSRAMTYKAAIAGLKLGGGKAVISLPKDKEIDRHELFSAFGRAVEKLHGRYITTEDSGTTPKDMEVIREQTKHVVGFPEQLGGSGDPSPSTARGVLRSVEAVAKKVLGRDKLEGLKIAIQGVGNVGFRLAEMLHESGASLVIADINQHRVEQASKKLGAEVVSLDEIFKVKCDIISPCALGAVITDEVANGLQCDAVVGAANNILADYNAGKILANRNIFYAPDYVANAGGLIHVAKELDGFDPKIVAEKTDNIYNTISDLVDRVKKEGIRPELLADRIAEERLMQARD